MNSNAFAVRQTPGYALVEVLGDADIANTGELEAMLLGALAGAPGVIVSFERCPYLDSSALSTLVRCRSAAKPGQRIVILNPRATATDRIFDIVGFRQIFPFAETLEQAQALVRGGEFGAGAIRTRDTV